jgi:putative colanic acid biosynthesis UDP-glucose lipid carrier transferase
MSSPQDAQSPDLADSPPSSRSIESGPLSAAVRLTDLLLGAVHADPQGGPEEHDALRGIIRHLLGRDKLPSRVEARLRDFDPQQFDLQAAAKRYSEKPAIDHRRLMELVHEVCEADGVVELSENGYMVALMLALRMDAAEVADLVLVSPLEGRGAIVKRIEDMALSAAALLALALPMAFIGAGVKATSKGPVLFAQKRYGLDGESFRIWKFRTMTVAEDGHDVAQATKNDPRVTPFGAFLRRTSLDELPQFFNVLLGDMSLVGPRPHAVAHNEKYKRLIPKYMLRHAIKPGITGWAQVNGWRGETDTLEKMIRRVEHDVHYVRHWTFWLDLKILFLTVFGSGTRQNAY